MPDAAMTGVSSSRIRPFGTANTTLTSANTNLAALAAGSEAVRWNRLLGASARLSCQPTFTDKTLSFAFLSFA